MEYQEYVTYDQAGRKKISLRPTGKILQEEIVEPASMPKYQYAYSLRQRRYNMRGGGFLVPLIKLNEEGKTIKITGKWITEDEAKKQGLKSID